MSKIKYDMKCKHCDHKWMFEATMTEYATLQPTSPEWCCPWCDTINGKNQRQMGGNITKIVIGVSKGYY